MKVHMVWLLSALSLTALASYHRQSTNSPRFLSRKVRQMYSEMSDLKTEMAELKQRVGSVEEQGDNYKAIAEEVHPVVFFNARRLQNNKPSVGETLQYTTIDQNVGDAFDQDSGVFTSPYSGVFLFTVQVSHEEEKGSRVKLVVNDEQVLSVVGFDDTFVTTTSGTTVQRLDVGDRVWVKQDVYINDNVEYKDGLNYGWNQFSGVLLYKLVE